MRTNQSKHLLFGIIVLMLFSFKSYGQDSWTLLKEESNVQVYYLTSTCGSMADIDPLDVGTTPDDYEIFKLKINNNNAASITTTLTFSEITKIDDSDETRTISIPSGTTILESCEEAPKLILSKQDGDQFPIAFTDYLNDFIINIQNK